MSAGGGSNKLISVHPEELRFLFELEKQTYCDLKIANNTENYVAFKVKTTSPKKYFVRPNTGIVQPRDSCVIRVTLQAQVEYPPNMQCNDKFLLQTTKVEQHSEVEELPSDTFSKESGRKIEEFKLKVFYLSPRENFGSSENELPRTQSGSDNVSSYTQTFLLSPFSYKDLIVINHGVLIQDMLKRQKNQKGVDSSGFFLAYAIMVALVGIMMGLLLDIAAA
ncbi:vesicle-associated protein 2-1-like [Impatiens glandulifera]|uniref:vesicle-associated protein 2-1-like n=1 Tax=Impatiens glandulifera TaxID=253017 RepID=UPI001FB182C9|nr:vesicle-associated protein 2-1-like [Impatiens glandulifera]